MVDDENWYIATRKSFTSLVRKRVELMFLSLALRKTCFQTLEKFTASVQSMKLFSCRQHNIVVLCFYQVIIACRIEVMWWADVFPCIV